MAEQLGWYNTVTLTAAATAQSIYALVTNTSLAYALPKNLPGQCVSLSFTADVPIKVGFASGDLDDTHGGGLGANTPFTDSASGVSGNTIPLGQMYVYSPTASGTATLTIYLRFVG
jgi:hypothetical protein